MIGLSGRIGHYSFILQANKKRNDVGTRYGSIHVQLVNIISMKSRYDGKSL